MYQNNLKIHTKYNKNLLKHSAFKRSNASKRNHSNFINSMDTDRSSQFRKKSVKSSIENSPNFVHKNNSQGKIVQQQFKNSGSDLKIMQINIKETKFQQENSIISMSSSRRDENLSKNMSSIIQNSSGPYVGISQSNLIDSFIAPSNNKNEEL